MGLILLFVWVIFAAVIGNAASQRGRSAIGWFLFSMIFSPLIAGLFLLLFPSLRDLDLERTAVDDKTLNAAIRKGRNR